MRLSGIISREEAESIHRSALRVLEKVGVRVEHPKVRKRLSVCGGRTKAGSDRVCFPAREVEKHLAAAIGRPLEESSPWVGAHVEVYGGCRYENPKSGKLEAFTEKKLACYFGLAENLPMISSVMLEGMPFPVAGVPAYCGSLSEKVYAWKFGVRSAGSINSVKFCEPLLELFSCHAAATGRKLEQVSDASIGLESPLRMGLYNCQKLIFFSEHGLKVDYFNWPVIGSTAPGSIVGTAVQGLAERIFIYLLRRSFWDDARLYIDGTAKTFDPRSKRACVGRPETQLVNLIFAEMGRFYGCRSGGMHGLTDAAMSSYEAGVQKALGALLTVFSCGYSSIAAGALDLVNICSPVQLVLDNDLTACLERMVTRPDVDEPEAAVAEIAAAIKTGHFPKGRFSAERDRKRFFVPSTWPSGKPSGPNRARRMDVDLAREIALDFQKNFVPASNISAQEERELWAIVRRAARKIKP